MKKLIIAMLALGASAVSVAPALAQNLATRSGLELGLGVSQYSYKEPPLDLEIGGSKVGGSLAYTFVKDEWFLKTSIEGTYGFLQYSAARSGTSSGALDSRTEGRIVIGRDFLLRENISLSPYTGGGYRFLYNDLRGYSSNGDIGYRRMNAIAYVPMGVTSRIHVESGWAIAINGEYDYFLQGKQKTILTDTRIRGLRDVTNSQKDGYGMRGSIRFEKESWSFGPWVQGWNIGKSSIVPYKPGSGWYEPANNTLEFGLEVRYHS